MGKSPMSNGTSAGRFLEKVGHPQVMGFPVLDFGEYPLVNLQKNDGKSTPFFIGKLTISMAIFNSYVKLPEGIIHYIPYKSL